MMILHWSRIWSPLVPEDSISDSWQQLRLPGSWHEHQTAFLSAFHHGMPTPQISLLLHHTLGLPGNSTREEWMRLMSWLGLDLSEARLPPDHLAIACEAIAVAVDKDESVIVSEVLERYLFPWCELALTSLGTKEILRRVPLLFKEELNSLQTSMATGSV